jgi:hypothetical protein
MGEKPTGHCKSCLEEVVKTFSGQVAKSGNYLYLDEHGRLWKGSVCPTCQAKIRKARYKSKRRSPETGLDATQGVKLDKDPSKE